MKSENNSTKKGGKKYYAAAIIGALAIAVVSWAIINQNEVIEDEGQEHIDLNDYADGDDSSNQLGSEIDYNIDFSELYPQKQEPEMTTIDEALNNNADDIPIDEAKSNDEDEPEAEPAVEKIDTAQAEENQPDASQEAPVEKPDSEPVSSGEVTEPEESLETAVAGLVFNEAQGLSWPVKGNVILNYSNDHVVYHATLNQFRTNPAILIGCEAGSEVTAAADGIITDITQTPQTGITVTMAIGSDYSLVYGQLEASELKVGDRVSAGSVIGKTAAVSRFYSVEGDNLYFQVFKSGETVNPMLLIK